jgi:hypothetical protein
MLGCFIIFKATMFRTGDINNLCVSKTALSHLFAPSKVEQTLH